MTIQTPGNRRKISELSGILARECTPVHVPACVEVAHVCLASNANLREVFMKPGVGSSSESYLNVSCVLIDKSKGECARVHARAWMSCS